MTTIQIPKTVAELDALTNAQLAALFNHLTGQQVERFKSKEAGRRRVEMAMLAAKDADAHLGVPKGGEGEVRTAEEIATQPGESLVDTVAAARSEERAGQADQDALQGRPVFPPDTLAGRLQAQAEQSKPIEPRPRATPAAKEGKGTKPRKPAYVRLAPAGVGRTKVRPSGVIGQVLAQIATQPVGEDGRPAPVALKALSDQLGFDCRGYAGRLHARGAHIEYCDADGNTILPAV